MRRAGSGFGIGGSAQVMSSVMAAVASAGRAPASIYAALDAVLAEDYGASLVQGVEELMLEDELNESDAQQRRDEAAEAAAAAGDALFALTGRSILANDWRGDSLFPPALLTPAQLMMAGAAGSAGAAAGGFQSAFQPAIARAPSSIWASMADVPAAYTPAVPPASHFPTALPMVLFCARGLFFFFFFFFFSPP
jgi:hypothetical protein